MADEVVSQPEGAEDQVHIEESVVDSDPVQSGEVGQAQKSAPPRSIPYSAFRERIASKNEKIEGLRAENESLRASAGISDQRLTEAQELIRQSLKGDIDETRQAVIQVAEYLKENEARTEFQRMVDSFTARIPDHVPEEVRNATLEQLAEAESKGQYLDPELVLAYNVGQAALSGATTRAGAARQQAKQFSDANHVAQSMGGNDVSVSSKPLNEKSLSEMTTAEIEERFGSLPMKSR